MRLNLGLGLGLDHWSFIWFRAFFKVYALLNSKLIKPLHKGMAETDISHEFGIWFSSWFLQFLALIVLICYTCLIIMLYFTCLWAVRTLSLTLSHRGMFPFSVRSILLPFILSVMPDHFIFMVSHKACLSSCIFSGLT